MPWLKRTPLTENDLWAPKLSDYPVDLKNIKGIKFADLVKAIRHDIILADEILLANSPRLKPFQKVTMRAFRDHAFCWCQACRGSGKSYIAARYLLVEGLLNTIRVVHTGPTYRQALHTWNYIESLIHENSLDGSPLDLSRELAGPITHGSMESVIELKNGTSFRALPMGNGQKLRGQRADVLDIDEAFLVEREMYQSHIVPFLLGHKEEGSIGPKLIMTTSAEYEDSFAYQGVLAGRFLPNIIKESKLVQIDPTYRRKYIVLDWNVDDVRASGYNLSQDVLDLLLEGASEDERAQALYNKWVGVSGQFFPADLLDRMQSTEIDIEYRAEDGYDYGLAIDVATQRNGDFFVIHVCKFLPDRMRMAVVHSYWGKGKTADEMAWIIHDYNTKFNPKFIVMDKGGGGLFVLQSLSKSTLEFADGTIKKVSAPLLEHNEMVRMDGERKIIMNRASDDMVRAGLADDRSRMGEYIHSEDILIHLIHDGMRQAMKREDPPILVPATYRSNRGDEENSEAVIFDNIKESVLQLRHLTMDVKELADGTKEVVRSKVNKVPVYKWRNQNKDGASAMTYAYLLYRIYYRHARREETEAAEPIIVKTPIYGSNFHGMVDYNPGERYNPFD